MCWPIAFGFSFSFVDQFAVFGMHVPALPRIVVDSCIGAYFIQCVVVLLIGKVATIAGLGLALELGSVIVAVLSLITMTMAALMRLSPSS